MSGTWPRGEGGSRAQPHAGTAAMEVEMKGTHAAAVASVRDAEAAVASTSVHSSKQRAPKFHMLIGVASSSTHVHTHPRLPARRTMTVLTPSEQVVSKVLTSAHVPLVPSSGDGAKPRAAGHTLPSAAGVCAPGMSRGRWYTTMHMCTDWTAVTAGAGGTALMSPACDGAVIPSRLGIEHRTVKKIHVHVHVYNMHMYMSLEAARGSTRVPPRLIGRSATAVMMTAEVMLTAEMSGVHHTNMCAPPSWELHSKLLGKSTMCTAGGVMGPRAGGGAIMHTARTAVVTSASGGAVATGEHGCQQLAEEVMKAVVVRPAGKQHTNTSAHTRPVSDSGESRASLMAIVWRAGGGKGATSRCSIADEGARIGQCTRQQRGRCR